MTAQILDGTATAKAIKAELTERVAKLREQGVVPGLGTVLVGDDSITTRTLEKSIGLQLFRRVGRGVVPTTVADTLRPHAEATIAAAEEALRAVQQVKAFETGTIRFGMSGSA